MNRPKKTRFRPDPRLDTRVLQRQMLRANSAAKRKAGNVIRK